MEHIGRTSVLHMVPGTALLGNALICGVISGPHDRYGARLVWIATFAVLLAAARRFGDEDEMEVEVEEVSLSA